MRIDNQVVSDEANRVPTLTDVKADKKDNPAHGYVKITVHPLLLFD